MARPEAASLSNAKPLAVPRAQRESSNGPESDRSPVLIRQSQSESSTSRNMRPLVASMEEM